MNKSECATEAQNSKFINNGVKGVWHRPNSSERETNLDELRIVLDEFKEAGINLVFLETFYHGMAVYKTDLVDYHIKLEGFDYGEYPDYLSAFMVEAEKRGISVYAWVQDFYIGFRDYIRLVTERPEWLLINQQGEIRHLTEGQGFGGYIFLDPANPEVRDFLISVYDDILTKYPNIKGLNLDYIRYPISEIEEGTDTGYTKASMREFAEKQGLEIDDNISVAEFNKIIVDGGLADEWTAHRAAYVTGFVEGVRKMINEKHRGKLISTAVFAEVGQTYHLKKQNIKVWLDNGYVDFVTPMVYFYEAEQIFESVSKMKAMCGGIPCYSGLYTTYHNQTTSELAEHIKASERAGAEGFVLFDAAKTFFEAKEDYRGVLSRLND
ncbi:MAG: family 10 glycosylhydrolase [Clostridia bacterium]|nr:family 10 glycosylhydrolase [Clostridia bacterium]